VKLPINQTPMGPTIMFRLETVNKPLLDSVTYSSSLVIKSINVMLLLLYHTLNSKAAVFTIERNPSK